MKIAFLGDMHYGVKGNSPYFLNHTKKFLQECFFPCIKKHKIEKIVQFGDLVDSRKNINFLTATHLMNDFVKPMDGHELHIILGNHDTYWKESNEVNALNTLLTDRYENIHIHEEISEVVFDKTKFLMVPWICKENEQHVNKVMSTTKAKIVCGHFEINGAECNKGQIFHGGQDSKLFDRFSSVFSGHFHIPSNYHNIRYLGSFSWFNWGDYDTDRGFYIFDTKTEKLEFIKNPFPIFQKFIYDDLGKTEEQVFDLKLESAANCFARIIVKSKTNQKLFDKFLRTIEGYNPENIQVVDDYLNLQLISENVTPIETKDTLEIFREYFGNIKDVDANKLDNFVVNLYNEAISLE